MPLHFGQRNRRSGAGFGLAGGSGMPWEGPLQQIVDSITGPVVQAAAVVAVVLFGAGVAMSENGLEAISRFAAEGIKTNCTLIFSTNQGLLAARAGASLISPFVGRLDDINQDGIEMIRELAEVLAIHEIPAEIISASIRHPLHVTQSALAGAHIATVPFKVLQQMVHHPLTDKGIDQFKKDWAAARAAAEAKNKA